MELLEARSSKGETSAFSSQPLEDTSPWQPSPTSTFSPRLNPTHRLDLSRNGVFSKKSALTFPFKLGSPVMASHLIQLFSFPALIMAYNDIFMSVTTSLLPVSSLRLHKLPEARDFVYLVP